MPYNFVSGMNTKKVTHGGGMGEGEEPSKFPLGSGNSVFTNIQAISTLVILQLDDNWYLIGNCDPEGLNYLFSTKPH